MSIQKSINQALSIGSLIASQSPIATARKYQKTQDEILKEKLKGSEARKKILNSASNKSSQKELIKQTGEELESIQKDIATMDPSQHNIDEYLKTVTQNKQWLKHQKSLERRRAMYAAKKEAQINTADRMDELRSIRSKMGFETRKSIILDQYANPLEVKNER